MATATNHALPTIDQVRSYKTYDAAQRTAENFVAEPQYHHLRYLIAATPAGRFAPVFLGQDAIQAGAHFHFAVVA